MRTTVSPVNTVKANDPSRLRAPASSTGKLCRPASLRQPQQSCPPTAFASVTVTAEGRNKDER